MLFFDFMLLFPLIAFGYAFWDATHPDREWFMIILSSLFLVTFVFAGVIFNVHYFHIHHTLI